MVATKAAPIFPSLGRPVRALLGPVLIAELQYHLGIESLRALERKIDGDKFRLPPPQNAWTKSDQSANIRRRTTYPCLLSKYKRGKSLPSAERIERMIQLCPELARVAQLPLWPILDSPRAGNLVFFVIYHAMARLPKEIWSFATPGQLVPNGFPTRALEEMTLKPLEKIRSVDAFSALLGLFKKMSVSYSDKKKIGISYRFRDDENLLRVADAAMSIFRHLVAFPPFYPVRNQLQTYLVQDFFPSDEAIDGTMMAIADLDKVTTETRKLIELVGALGLIGSSFADQITLAYWFHKDGHGEDTIRAIDSLYRESRWTRGTIVTQTHPLYSLLRRIRHWEVRRNRPIVIPKKRRRGNLYRGLANAIDYGEERPVGDRNDSA